MYSIDFDKLGRILIPPFLRQPKQVAWIRSLLSPLQIINSRFVSLRTRSIYDASHDSTVISIEHYLNHHYDTTGIYITDGLLRHPAYVFTAQEPNECYIKKSTETDPTPVFVHPRELPSYYDFVVNVPFDLDFEMEEMVALVKMLKLAGKQFKIKRYFSNYSASWDQDICVGKSEDFVINWDGDVFLVVGSKYEARWDQDICSASGANYESWWDQDVCRAVSPGYSIRWDKDFCVGTKNQ